MRSSRPVMRHWLVAASAQIVCARGASPAFGCRRLNAVVRPAVGSGMSSRPTSHYLAGLYLLAWAAGLVFATAHFYFSNCVHSAAPIVNCSVYASLWPLIGALPPIVAVI